MTSSLLFAGSTCGWVNETWPTEIPRWIYLPISFAFGTVLVESILKALGRIQLGTGRNAIVPPRTVRLFTARNGTGGYSASQARSLTLIIASVLHGCHFIMIGLKGGFGVTFLAYAVAAFARALLTGQLYCPISKLFDILTISLFSACLWILSCVTASHSWLTYMFI